MLSWQKSRRYVKDVVVIDLICLVRKRTTSKQLTLIIAQQNDGSVNKKWRPLIVQKAVRRHSGSVGFLVPTELMSTLLACG